MLSIWLVSNGKDEPGTTCIYSRTPESRSKGDLKKKSAPITVSAPSGFLGDFPQPKSTWTEPGWPVSKNSSGTPVCQYVDIPLDPISVDRNNLNLSFATLFVVKVEKISLIHVADIY